MIIRRTLSRSRPRRMQNRALRCLLRAAPKVPHQSGPAKPNSPLTLKPPPAPSPMLEGTDLRKVPAQRLAGVARRLYDGKQYPQAIQALHHAIAAGADGGYDLACDYALTENVDAAFYWLQKVRSMKASTRYGPARIPTWKSSEKTAAGPRSRPFSLPATPTGRKAAIPR